MSNNYYIKSVLRALDILEYLASREGSGRVTDIARETGCSKNTAFRLLQTLQERNFVRQAEDSSYELTFKLLNLGESVIRSSEVHEVARPYLQALASQCGETVTLGILDGDEIVYLDRVLGSSPFNTTYSIGSRAKAYSTALGKAILAFSAESTVEKSLDCELVPKTKYTLTDVAQLRAELRETARRRYAIDNQENVLGIRCLGAPVFDRKGGAIAAISVSGLAARMIDERVNELADSLLTTAATISTRLGYTSS